MSVLSEITFTNQSDTRAIVDEVVEHAFESVCSTMGPNGQYVVINQLNLPKVTKDGVSVAKALDFNEARRNLIAHIITEPSIKTDLEVGDGTTTTVFMTYKLYKAFADKLTFKNSRYLDQTLAKVSEFIGTLIQPGDITSPQFRNMLMTSSNYEEEIVEKVLGIFMNTKNPNITLHNAPSLPEDTIDHTTEIKFSGQFAANNFEPQSGFKPIRANSSYIIIVDGSVQSINNLREIGSLGVDNGVVIMARNFEPTAIGQINSYNQLVGTTKILPYKVNAAGSLGTDTLADLGKLIGVEPIFNLDSVDPKLVKGSDVELVLHAVGVLINSVDTVVAKRTAEMLIGLDERYERQSIIDRQTPIGRELFRRISRLRANNVTIKVTGVTASDATERYYRYEDVMKAAHTGQQYGVIPGIGYGYLMASNYVADQLPQQSDEELESCRQLLIKVLRSQYEHLTGYDYNGGTPTFIDLVTGEESTTPMNVFDNAAATMIALKGAWQTAKTLGKISNVMGRSNKSYS